MKTSKVKYKYKSTNTCTNRPEPGESEAALRELFMELETIGGGVLVLDNVECCAGGRGDRLTSQLLTLLDTCR